jgi:hypothetical protein
VSRDVGGGYGTRNHTYPEFALVLWAARQVGRPVKWVCSRSEAFLSDYAGREGRPGSAELGQILGALRNAGSQGDVDRLIGTACRILCAGGTMERARNRAELEVSAAFGEIDDAPESLRIRLVEFARGLLFGMGDTRAVA